MKTLFIILLFTLQCTVKWGGDLDAAKKQAKEENKLILLYFSGSDWCPHCMKMKKDILDTKAFDDYAAQHLVLVNADFPRKKKNKLSDEQVKRNDAMAEKYNPGGKFPYTVVLDANGKVLKEWEGEVHLTPEQFTNEISKLSAAAAK